jgi:hypothetical protein
MGVLDKEGNIDSESSDIWKISLIYFILYFLNYTTLNFDFS